MTMTPQTAHFRKMKRRVKRTLNYGEKAPRSVNLPLSEMVVDYFNKACPFSYMRAETSASISSNGFADPCTLVVAMVYLDRLRMKDRTFFEASNATDLYLPALVLASKYVHENDSMESACNSDWAAIADISTAHMNTLEWEFVDKVNWELMVNPDQFEEKLSAVELWVARYALSHNADLTYNELRLLSNALSSVELWNAFKTLATAIGVASLVYAAAVASVVSAPSLMSRVDPASTNNSLPCLAQSLPYTRLVPLDGWDDMGEEKAWSWSMPMDVYEPAVLAKYVEPDCEYLALPTMFNFSMPSLSFASLATVY